MDEVMSMGNELIGKVGDNSSIFWQVPIGQVWPS